MDTEGSLPLHPRQPQHTLTSKFSYLCSASSPLTTVATCTPSSFPTRKTCQLDKFNLKTRLTPYKSRFCTSKHAPRRRTDKLRNDRRPKDVNPCSRQIEKKNNKCSSAPQSAGKTCLQNFNDSEKDVFPWDGEMRTH